MRARPPSTSRPAHLVVFTLIGCCAAASSAPLDAQQVETVPCSANIARDSVIALAVAAGLPSATSRDTVALACKAARTQLAADEAEDRSFSVPESPAFTFLSTSPAEIARPSSPREFAAALANGVDAQGRVQQGFALEFSPFPVVPGFVVPLREYQRSFLKRAAYRTQISLGTTRASGDSSSTDLALGVRTTLIDEADPMQSRRFTDSLSNRMMQCIPSLPGSDTTEALRCIEGAIEATRQQWLERWNSRRLVIAFAFGQRFLNSSPSDRVGLGWRAWALGSNPLGEWGIVLGYLEVGRRNAVDGNPSFGSFRYGGRAVVGASTLNGFLEIIGESRFDAPAGADDGGTSWSAGLEIKATDGVWLSTGFGQRYTEAQAPDRLLVIANLRFGLSKGARFADLQRNQFESE